ncbi:glycosyltransferase [Frigidibacter sp. RF13]|uniref:glycosyltransferase family 2 protein n=1 Tax=Frigidibacter sp. RF13 TaxID=2997340 RepID=UPI00226E0FBD|nr:glycosyltransferase [Frigidibacter sp. RF13]MCY1127476.1 glycosyltransferase [Frigidibacter sp. RF13]
MRPRISVVIPHLNQPAMLDRCLASIAAGSRAPDEVVVADNGSQEMPETICARYPFVRLIRETTPGPGPARNAGIARTTGEVLAFIDADCVADPGWLAAAEAEMARPGATVLGGDVRILYVDPARLTMLEAYESIYAYRMDRYIARKNFTGTGNLVMTRAVFDDVGPFAGLSVAEDTDWGQRATAKGYRIRFVAGMRVYHPARERFAELRSKWDRHTAHFFDGVRGNFRRTVLWALKCGAMAASPLAELPQIVTSDRVSGIRNRLLALAGLIRIRLYRARIMAWLLFGGDPDRLSGRWNRPSAAAAAKPD